MRLLLDTNALLWLLGGEDRLGASARESVEQAETLTVSVASLWEIAIKVSLGKLAPIPRLPQVIRTLGFERLGIDDGHLAALQDLPHHHRDPFDRLLISQASVERLTIVTADSAFTGYAVPVLDARV